MITPENTWKPWNPVIKKKNCPYCCGPYSFDVKSAPYTIVPFLPLFNEFQYASSASFPVKRITFVYALPLPSVFKINFISLSAALFQVATDPSCNLILPSCTCPAITAVLKWWNNSSADSLITSPFLWCFPASTTVNDSNSPNSPATIARDPLYCPSVNSTLPKCVPWIK